MLGDSQLPITLVPWDVMPFSRLQGHPTTRGAPNPQLQTHPCTHNKNKIYKKKKKKIMILSKMTKVNRNIK